MKKQNTKSIIQAMAAGTALLQLSAISLVTWGFALSANANERKTTIITFDAPGSGTTPGQGTVAVDVSPNGTITGYYNSGNVFHGFVRAPDGTFITFGVPGAGTGPFQGTFAYSINPAGAITGNYFDAKNVSHGYVRASNGAITTFDVPGASATVSYNINPAGAIAGHDIDASNVAHGFVRALNGAITTFDAPGAGTASGQGTFTAAADGINPAGAIPGTYVDASNVNHGFVRAPNGVITTFDAPGAGTNGALGQGTLVTGINPAGTVMGYSIDGSNVAHGFVRAPNGAISTFDVPGAGTGPGQGTFGEGINPVGTIPGNYIDASNVNHGFVRDKHGVLTTFDAPGAGTNGALGQGTFPATPNPAGAITGWFIDASNVAHGFLVAGEGGE